jgi:hypothetical protein
MLDHNQSLREREREACRLVGKVRVHLGEDTRWTTTDQS